jgi:hypothetical protein
MVTMSQKSSFLQPANSVSQVLIPDTIASAAFFADARSYDWAAPRTGYVDYPFLEQAIAAGQPM